MPLDGPKPDAKKAEKYLTAKLKQLHADQIGARTFETPQARRLTVAELCAALKSDFELRGKASPQNLSHLKRVTSYFGQFRAAELDSAVIDKYVEQRLADGDKPAGINRALQLLSQGFGLAIRRGTLARGPHVRHLSEAGNARQGFLGEKELETVIAHLPADLRDFTRFGFLTGWRKGEIASLTWADLDGGSLRLRGENSKNGEARVLPFVGALAEVIARRKKARRMDSEFLFHRDGAAVAEFRKSWATACRKAGVPGTLFHDLRRSACRRMIRAGVPQAVAQKISGHKTASMFARYSIIAESDLREALEQTQAYKETAKVVSMRS